MNNPETEPDLPQVPIPEPLAPLPPAPQPLAPQPLAPQPLAPQPLAPQPLPGVASTVPSELPPMGSAPGALPPGAMQPPGFTASPGFTPPPFPGGPSMPVAAPKKKRRVWLIVIGIIVAIVAAVAGLVWWYWGYAEGLTFKAEQAVPDHAVIGSCWNEVDGSSSAVACDRPHDFEVYEEIFYFSGPYPELYLAGDFCEESFETYVGSSYWTSDYDYLLVRPSEESWADGNQIGFCVLYVEFQGKSTGSARSLGR